MKRTTDPEIMRATVLSGVPVSVEGSPYQSKLSDPHSSHSVILGLLPQVVGGRALDVGAAHGYMAAALRDRGFRVTGIEADPDLAREAANYCHETVVADLDGPLPQFEAQFDIILLGDVLEHLKSPQSVLATLLHALRPDGVVVISLPNVANAYIRGQLLIGRFDYADRGILDRTHLRFYTRKTFRQLTEEAGLEIVHFTATPIPLPMVVPDRFHGRLLSLVHDGNAWLARTWQTMFGYQFIAVARRRKSR